MLKGMADPDDEAFHRYLNLQPHQFNTATEKLRVWQRAHTAGYMDGYHGFPPASEAVRYVGGHESGVAAAKAGEPLYDD